MKMIAGGYGDDWEDNPDSALERLLECWPEFFSLFSYALIRKVDSTFPVGTAWPSFQALPPELRSTASDAAGGVAMPCADLAKLVSRGFFNGFDEILFLDRFPADGCKDIRIPYFEGLLRDPSPTYVQSFDVLSSAMRNVGGVLAMHDGLGVGYFTLQIDIAKRIDALFG